MRRVALRMPSVIASPKTTSKAESLAGAILLAPAMPAPRAACGWSASPINLQLLAAGLGQQQRGKDKDQVGAGGEYRDGVSQGHGGAEVPNPAGEKFGEKGADGAERAGREEPQREAQHQHHLIADGQESVSGHRHERADGKEDQRSLPPQ